MSRRVVVAAVAAVALLSPVRAFAQEANASVDTNASNAVTTMVTAQPLLKAASEAAVAADAVDAQRVPTGRISFDNRRSMVMPALYASTAMMQALDIHSTMSGLKRGAVEANPMMSGVTSNKGAFMAVKAGVAVGTIFAARKMAKTNKVAAALTLIGINSVYAAVVSHNYKVARAGR